MSFEVLAAQGKTRQYENLAASVGPRIREIRKQYVRDSFRGLQQVEHRLELVATIQGMEFINDSRSSNINSTWFALDNYYQPMIWIVGGIENGNDYSTVMDLVRNKVRKIICLGVDNTRIIEAFNSTGIPVCTTTSMEEAVHEAYCSGEKGDVILLSPACASFDLFENYEERGMAFRRAVKNL